MQSTIVSENNNFSGFTNYYRMPRNIGPSLSTFEFVAGLSQRLKKIKNDVVFFDFSDTLFFDSSICCTIGSIVHNLKVNSNLVIFLSVDPDVKDTLNKNNFYSTFTELDNLANPNIYNGVIQCAIFKAAESQRFVGYVDALLSELTTIKISTSLQDMISQSLLEIFNNIKIHSHCDTVYISGNNSNNKLGITMCDLGLNIRKVVNDFHAAKFSAVKSIAWAVEKGNTTRPKALNVPGGLGFSLIRSFLRVNKGRFQIISEKGNWEENNAIIFARSMKKPFLGTIIYIEINLDNEEYMLSSELEQLRIS